MDIATAETQTVMPEMLSRGCFNTLAGEQALFDFYQTHFYQAFIWGRNSSTNELQTVNAKTDVSIARMYQLSCILPGPDEAFVRSVLSVKFQAVYNLGRLS
jgi:hypothetical protein